MSSSPDVVGLALELDHAVALVGENPEHAHHAGDLGDEEACRPADGLEPLVRVVLVQSSKQLEGPRELFVQGQ